MCEIINTRTCTKYKYSLAGAYGERSGAAGARDEHRQRLRGGLAAGLGCGGRAAALVHLVRDAREESLAALAGARRCLRMRVGGGLNGARAAARPGAPRQRGQHDRLVLQPAARRQRCALFPTLPSSTHSISTFCLVLSAYFLAPSLCLGSMSASYYRVSVQFTWNLCARDFHAQEPNH